MKLADLPVVEASRVMSESAADDLVGTAVPERNANVVEAGIYVDAETGEPFLAYFPLEERVALLRAAVRGIKYSETVRQKTGSRNRSAVFGMLPRKVFQKRESCRPAALSHEHSAEHAVLVAFADQLDELYREWAPDLWQADKATMAGSGISDEWRMTDGSLWTSGVVNASSTLPYHRDGFNYSTWSAMPVVRRAMAGGYLDFPEYGLTVECRDGWVLFFPGYKYLHGVTPMAPTSPDAYRYSIVYYALRGMKDCFTYAVESARGRRSRTDREDGIAAAVKGEREFLVERPRKK